MLDSIKSIFRSKTKSVLHKHISLNYDGEAMLAVLRQCAAETYPAAHAFPRQYLLPFIAPLNQTYAKQFEAHISSINANKYKPILLGQVLEQQLVAAEGWVRVVLQLWNPYLLTELPTYYDTLKFFRVEIHLLVEYILAVLTTLYGQQGLNPEQNMDISSARFRLRVLSVITDNYQFQKIKTIVVKKCKLGVGSNGVFTTSQVELSTNQLDALIKFKQIPAPFHQSIGLMLEFYEEYRIDRKVQKLVLAVEKAKEEILEYRSFFGMGGTAIGSDQVMPVLNFICEKTGKNIFASVQYIRALLGGRVYNQEECNRKLKLIQNTADYCLDLVESMSTIYCHASRMY